MTYARYALKRVFYALVTAFLGISLLYFMPLIKGDPTVHFSIPDYLDYMSKILRMEMGFSKFYRTDVAPLVWRYMPYTMLLCLFSCGMAWILGSLIGLFSGAHTSKITSKIVRGAAMAVYPIPYYILALLVQIIFAYILGWFPVIGEIITGDGFARFAVTCLRSSVLPAVSIILSNLGWWIISMNALVSTQCSEEYVLFARLRGIDDRKVLYKYVLPECMPMQVTNFGIQLGTAFGGSIITEMMYSYPGVGFLMLRGVMNNDYNLLNGAAVISIIAIAFFTCVSDLIMPLVDPRVRNI